MARGTIPRPCPLIPRCETPDGVVPSAGLFTQRDPAAARGLSGKNASDEHALL